MNGAIGFDGLLTGNINTGGTGTTDYNDLTNKPSINGVSLYGNKTSADLHLFTGDYDNLSNLPSINNVVLTGNKTTEDLGLFDGDYEHLTNKPTLFSGDYNDLTNKPTLFSGDYNDLTNKPTLFDGDYDSLNDRPQINGITLTGDQTADDLGLFDGDYDHLTNKPTLFSGDYNDLYNKPTLFSGDYNDLTNKPTLFDGNYMSLTNRPYINGVALENNKTTSDLEISYNDLLDLPTIPGIEFNPADPATDEVETIDLDGTVYEVKDADARAEIDLLEDDIAPEYDATATYSTGDYCMYAGTIYEANTNISTPEAFTPGHWDATSAGEELSQIKQSLSDLENVIDQIDGITIYKQILNQDIVSFSTDNSMPIMKLVSNISNVSGCTEVNVTVCGTNIWDEEWEVVNSRLSSKNYIPVKPNTTYLFCNTMLYSITGFDINKNNVGGTSYTQIPNVGFTFTTKSDWAYIKFNLGYSYGTTYNNDVSINYPSTDTSYHAYNGNTYNVPFVDGGGSTLTIYDGSIDLISGVLIDNDNTTTYQLNATPINNLQGVNNIWSDTGSIANVGYLDILNIS